MIDRNGFLDEYFEWMKSFIIVDQPEGSYDLLLRYLNSVEFTYILLMDENRYNDGMDLRYRFGLDLEYSYKDIEEYLDNDRPCTILEMMIALALRCEEHIMDDPDIGDRTGVWFWGMIESLGLLSQRDEKFDPLYCEMVIDRFLEREYKKNGEGGLFALKHPRKDMRNVEIWYQLQAYLNERSNL